MKPRISRTMNSQLGPRQFLWVCEGGKLIGFGESPVLAYHDWARRKRHAVHVADWIAKL